MKKWITCGFFLPGVLLVPILSCASDDNSDSTALKKILITISKEAPDWSVRDPEPYKLESQKEFLEIRNHPCYYFKTAENLISSKQLTEDQQMILPYAFMKLPLKNYLEWMEYSVEAYQGKLVPADFVDFIIFPDPDQRRDVYFATDVKDVTDFYLALPKKLNLNTSDTKQQNKWTELATKTATGERARELLPYMKGYNIPVPTVDMKSTCN